MRLKSPLLNTGKFLMVPIEGCSEVGCGGERERNVKAVPAAFNNGKHSAKIASVMMKMRSTMMELEQTVAFIGTENFTKN